MLFRSKKALLRRKESKRSQEEMALMKETSYNYQKFSELEEQTQKLQGERQKFVTKLASSRDRLARENDELKQKLAVYEAGGNPPADDTSVAKKGKLSRSNSKSSSNSRSNSQAETARSDETARTEATGRALESIKSEDDFEGGGKGEELSDEGLTSAEAEILMEKWGPNELPEKKKSKCELLTEQFMQPMPLMITAAFVIEGLLANYVDMVLLLILNIVNCGLAYYEASKAADAIAALKSSLKPAAQVKRDGKWENIDAKYLVPTDVVALNAGAAVPADCTIIAGHIDVDQAALTGESLPVTMMAGGQPKMGSTVVRGEVSAVVTFTGARSEEHTSELQSP